MDKVRIGIPRSLFYYYDGYFLKEFFKFLDFEVIISPHTNKSIIDDGIKYSNDEMCSSLKVFLGHISYLKNKCDYILIMRIDNYGLYEQTCTNLLSIYDIAKNIFNVPILDINIDYSNRQNMYNELYKICKFFNIKKKFFKQAYTYATVKQKKYYKNLQTINSNKLCKDGLKILLVGHSYNINDNCIGKPIISYLENNNINTICSHAFKNNKISNLSYKYCNNLYWRYNKENIGTVVYLEDKIDGVIFLSTFPCGPDSLVNELVIRKIKKPCLNLIVDDLNSLTGIETRLESFIDILGQKV